MYQENEFGQVSGILHRVATFESVQNFLTIPWHDTPKFHDMGQIAKIPWLFTDLEKILFFLTFHWHVATLLHSSQKKRVRHLSIYYVNYYFYFSKWNRMVIDIDLCRLVACVHTFFSAVQTIDLLHNAIGQFKSCKSSLYVYYRYEHFHDTICTTCVRFFHIISQGCNFAVNLKLRTWIWKQCFRLYDLKQIVDIHFMTTLCTCSTLIIYIVKPRCAVIDWCMPNCEIDRR